MYGYAALPSYTPIGFCINFFEEFMAQITASQKKKDYGSLARAHTPHYIHLLYELMDGVREGNSSGEYFGLPMTPGRTRNAAAMSGDYNEIHIGRLGIPDIDLIAHGFHGVTEALAALHLYHTTHGIKLRPKGIDIQFRQKVPLNGKPLRHKITPFRVGENPDLRTIMVFTTGNTLSEEAKPAIVIKVLLEAGSFDRKALGYNLYCGWLTSALLAETWPGCIFYQLTAAFGEPQKKEDWTKAVVQTTKSYESKSGQKHLIVATSAGTLSGEADIILPAQ